MGVKGPLNAKQFGIEKGLEFQMGTHFLKCISCSLAPQLLHENSISTVTHMRGMRAIMSLTWGFGASQVALAVKNLPARVQETSDTRVRSLGWEFPLGKARQPTPVVLPGESPWTEKPGGLQSMGSQRVGHD